MRVPLRHFNSIKVRLELSDHSDLTRQTSTNFNSIKVRLEQKAAKKAEKARANFNSIKVRLEHRRSGPRLLLTTISIP